MVRTHTLDPTPDAPRSYNILPIRLLKKDAGADIKGDWLLFMNREDDGSEE